MIIGNEVKVTVMLLGASLCLGASAMVAAADAGEVAAVWVPKEITFRYVGFTTKYSCDGLQSKMRDILLELGARADLQVARFACVRVNSPETTPGVRIAMHVLEPSGSASQPTVAAHWKKVDVLAGRDPADAALDCELIAQLHREVLPLFATRQVDYSAVCSANQPITGGTRLKAEVLVPDSSPPAAAAH